MYSKGSSIHMIFTHVFTLEFAAVIASVFTSTRTQHLADELRTFICPNSSLSAEKLSSMMSLMSLLHWWLQHPRGKTLPILIQIEERIFETTNRELYIRTILYIIIYIIIYIYISCQPQLRLTCWVPGCHVEKHTLLPPVTTLINLPRSFLNLRWHYCRIASGSVWTWAIPPKQREQIQMVGTMMP